MFKARDKIVVSFYDDSVENKEVKEWFESQEVLTIEKVIEGEGGVVVQAVVLFLHEISRVSSLEGAEEF